MTQPPRLPFGALLLAHDATAADSVRLAESAAVLITLGAKPVVVSLPPEIAPLMTGVRVVRTKAGAPAIAAIRLGMAQLTNTAAGVVLLVPLAAIPVTAPRLDLLLERSSRALGSIVAFAGTPLEDSPLAIPRAAWLELMTLGEQGVQAVAARVGVEWVE